MRLTSSCISSRLSDSEFSLPALWRGEPLAGVEESRVEDVVLAPTSAELTTDEAAKRQHPTLLPALLQALEVHEAVLYIIRQARSVKDEREKESISLYGTQQRTKLLLIYKERAGGLAPSAKCPQHSGWEKGEEWTWIEKKTKKRKEKEKKRERGYTYRKRWKSNVKRRK